MNAPANLAAPVNAGMDDDTFEQFAEQLQRYVRERLIPAEPQVIAEDRGQADILAEMRVIGLFGLSVPLEYGGAWLNMTQYARVVNIMAYAAPDAVMFAPERVYVHDFFGAQRQQILTFLC